MTQKTCRASHRVDKPVKQNSKVSGAKEGPRHVTQMKLRICSKTSHRAPSVPEFDPRGGIPVTSVNGTTAAVISRGRQGTTTKKEASRSSFPGAHSKT